MFMRGIKVYIVSHKYACYIIYMSTREYTVISQSILFGHLFHFYHLWFFENIKVNILYTTSIRSFLTLVNEIKFIVLIQNNERQFSFYFMVLCKLVTQLDCSVFKNMNLYFEENILYLF